MIIFISFFFSRMYKTLVEAIYERYNEMLDGNTFIASSSPESLNCDQQTPSQSSYDNKKDDNSLVSFYIPALSPRKTRKSTLKHLPLLSI